MNKDRITHRGSTQIDPIRLSIGQLASMTGETVKTVRYWTNLGLLVADRGDNGYRYYALAMIERARFIRASQALGFTLGEIVSILAIRAGGRRPCPEVRRHLEAHLATVRRRIAELTAVESDLAEHLRWANAHPHPECEPDGCVYVTGVEPPSRSIHPPDRGPLFPPTMPD